MPEAMCDLFDFVRESKKPRREDAWKKPGPNAVFECYLITNTINGKRYVGQGWYGGRRRWNEHKRTAASGKPKRGIVAAIAKYGADAFTFEVIGTASDEYELDELEIRMIAEYATFAPAGMGYNLTIGGGGCKKWQPTKETLANITAANRKMFSDPVYKAAVAAALKRSRETPEWRASYDAATLRKIAETDAADPAGAHQRAIARAAGLRSSARRRGLPVPKMIGPETYAERDAADPEGAPARAKAREGMVRYYARLAGEDVPYINDIKIAEQDARDPEGAAARADQRARSRRYSARLRGKDVPLIDRKALGAVAIEALDAADPDGAPKRARLRAAKERHKARKSGESVPLIPRRETEDVKIAAKDAADPDGAAKRAGQRAAHARRQARKAGNAVPGLRELAILAQDAADPDGADVRARSRAACRRSAARARGEDVPNLAKIAVVERDAADPAGAEQRRIWREAKARGAAAQKAAQLKLAAD